MDKLAIVVLAAGLGKRIGVDTAKALLRSSERSLIEHVLLGAEPLGAERVVVVTGHQAEQVEKEVRSAQAAKTFSFKRLEFARQAKQCGTGDAVRSALPALKDFTGTVLILCADMPLVKPETLSALLAMHSQQNATLTVLTLITPEPASYGRVIRDDKSGHVLKIVEARDCSPSELACNEINAAIYAVDSSFLAPAIESLTTDNSQKEFYFTDVVAKAHAEGQRIAAHRCYDESEIQGVNTLYELALINENLRRRAVKSLLEQGVEIVDRNSCFIDPASKIARGVKIGPNVQLVGACSLEAGVVLEGNAYLKDTVVKKGALVRFSVKTENAIIGENAVVGPFAHLRPGTELQQGVHIGNFVETKKALLETGSKANHLTYLGDCRVGAHTNIGAGTITCNYDGYNKHHTEIGKDVFIGSNTSLVAPVEIEDGAIVGAGSVITKKVEKDSLAFTRSPQVTKAGWAKRRKDNAKKPK